MQPYSIRAAEVACASQIAVQVLLSHDNSDLELVHLGTGQSYISRDEFAARHLRPVGVLGLNGLQAMSAFKEPLEPRVVNAIAQAFLEYVRVLLSGSFAEQMAHAEVRELEHMYSLPDTRTPA